MKENMQELLEKAGAYIDLFIQNPYKDSNMGRVISDIAAGKGKMVRPQLVFICGMSGEMFEEKKERLCKLAALVEITHMASLVHDDIVDDAPFRRGKPSIQSKYGKNEAVYAGDYLMSRVSYHLLKEDMNDAGMTLVKTIERMCDGEIGQSMCRYREDVTEMDYIRNIHGKTAALMMASCRIGAKEAGCDEYTVQLMEQFGEYLGLMFQLKDDLMDFTSDLETQGKKTNMDIREGIYTLPVIYTLSQPESREQLLPILKANEDGTVTEQELRELTWIIHTSGGMEKARRKMAYYQTQASMVLSKLPEANKNVSELLAALLHKLGTA